MAGFTTIVLAAGMGTRMRSAYPKVLHPLCGVPMIEHVLETVEKAGSTRTIVVVGHQAERVKSAINRSVEFAYQAEQLGTGHAVMQAEDLCQDVTGPILITYGDTPLYRVETIRDFVHQHVEEGAAASVLTAVVDDPTGYGRIMRSPEGEFERVVEQKDATPDEAAVREINTGTYCISSEYLFQGLRALRPENAQGEYYLPDLLEKLRKENHPVRAQLIGDPDEALGINDRQQLAQAEGILRRRIKQYWLQQGVTIVDPATTWIDAKVRIGADTILFPFTMLEGDTIVGERCRIGPFSHLCNASVGSDSVVERSYIHGKAFGPGTVIGPNAQHGDGETVERCAWLFDAVDRALSRGEE